MNLPLKQWQHSWRIGESNREAPQFRHHALMRLGYGTPIGTLVNNGVAKIGIFLEVILVPTYSRRLLSSGIDKLVERDLAISAAHLSQQLFNRCKCVQERSEEHTSELQSPMYLVCRLLLEKKKNRKYSKYN